MILKKMKMEDWFIKTSSCKYNFSESGVPDFTLTEFFKKIKVNKSILNNVFLGNNNTWGALELRKVIAGVYQNIKTDNLIVTNGTSEALYIFFNLFLTKKSKVFVLFPAFPILYLIPQAYGAKVCLFDILKFKKSKETMLKSLLFEIKKTKPDLLIINIPHNPTGFTFSSKEIIEIGRVAQSVKSTILFDEHYRFLPINDSENILPSGYNIVSKFYNKVFAVGSIIKSTGIVGTRVGWLIGNRPDLNKIRDYKDYTTHCVSLVNETIAKLAIENIEKIMYEFISRIRNNWLLLKSSDLVKRKKIVLNYELEGGCVCFPKINGFSSLKLAKLLASKYNISVMPGEAFDKKSYLRINLSQRIKYFKHLLKCINQVIK